MSRHRIQPARVRALLHRHGFLASPEGRGIPTDAVRAYQEWHGLPETGEVCSATARHLELPRFCGHADRMEDQAPVYRWPDGHITWCLTGDDLPGLPAAQLAECIAEACRRWAAVDSALSFVQVQDPSQARVLIATEQIDGPLGILGETELPTGSPQVHMVIDHNETWGVGPQTNRGTIDIVAVLAHELGHGLGLVHHQPGQGVPALMDPVLSSIDQPQAWDTQEMQRRYPGRPAPAQPPPPDLPPLPPPPPQPESVVVALPWLGVSVRIARAA